MMRSLRSSTAPLALALGFAMLAVAVLATAYGYSRSSGLFPIFVGWIFLALTLLELGALLRTALRDHAHVETAAVDSETTASTGGVLSKLGGFLWLGLLLSLLYLAGFLLAVPIFMFAFVHFAARRSVARSMVFAFVATAFVYVVFVQLLEYRLYSGVLLGG